MNREVIGVYQNMETGEESTIMEDCRTGLVDNIRIKKADKKAEQPAWKILEAYFQKVRIV